MGKKIDLGSYTEEELIALNEQIVERLRLIEQQRCTGAMMKFRSGDSVAFSSSGGNTVIGTVIRLNNKSATIVDEDGGRWRVSPSLLSKTRKTTTLSKEMKAIEEIHRLARQKRRKKK